MSSPTFRLPSCPYCSVLRRIEAPVWKYAHATSAARKRSCYQWVACSHAAGCADPKRIYDEPSEWSEVEAKWAAERERLFAAKTALWSDVERTRFRDAIDAKFFLPGATSPMQLSEQPAPL